MAISYTFSIQDIAQHVPAHRLGRAAAAYATAVTRALETAFPGRTVVVQAALQKGQLRITPGVRLAAVMVTIADVLDDDDFWHALLT